MRFLLLAFLSFFIPLLLPAQSKDSVGNLYPHSAAPDTVYLTSENLNKAEKLTLQSLMGVTAKQKPRILRDVSNHKDLLRNAHVVIIDSFYQNLDGLLKKFAPLFRGYILCRANDRSANVAISLSSPLQALVVPEELEDRVRATGLERLMDVRGKDETWALKNHGDSFSKITASYQDASGDRGNCLADYTIFTNSFQFWDRRAKGRLAKRVYRRMDEGGTFFGVWPDEYKSVEQFSKHSLMTHASDWAINLSTLTNLPVPIGKQKTVDSFVVTPGVHTVCFVMSDGDNIQWLLQAFNDTATWNNPRLKDLNLGWTISPALTELAPVVYNRYVELLSQQGRGRNTLIASPSGRGYYFPSLYPSLTNEMNRLDPFLQKAGLRIINIIDIDKSKMNPSVYLAQAQIDALFLYSFGKHYTGRSGQITWHEGKPCIGGRFALWDGAYDASSLAAELNKASTDISNADGYSLIPVHVWSRGVKDVESCIRLLNPTVRVVAPDEFVWLIKKNLRHD